MKKSFWDWFSFKKKRRVNVWKWRGKPLYRKDNRIYWKGIPVDDDEFEAVRQNPAELRQYNYWVRKTNRRMRNRKLRRFSKIFIV